MTAPALSFSTPDKLGKVSSVDTSRVYIDVEDHDLLTRVLVGNLVAIVGRTDQEFLIGITETVTRQVREEAALDAEDESGRVPIAEANIDTVRAVLIGTFRTRDGERENIFKRGADTFPQIDRPCFVIEAGNLQRLMGLLAEGLPEEKRLRLGRYIIDPTAVAVVDGNRFFQRHASILGSTGSGKSCAVALILEKAHALNFPNLIVLDIHGEYKPLTEGANALAAGFRIAGPGDLENPKDNTLFLPFWLLNREEMLALLLDRSDQNAPNQAARFTLHVRSLKEATLKELKRTRVLDTFTVDSPVPYGLTELLDSLRQDDVAMKAGARGPVQGDWFGKLTRFIGRLEAKVDDRRYGFMFKPPKQSSEYDWLAEQLIKLIGSSESQPGIKIVDFSEVPSDVLPVVAGVLARLVHEVQFWLQEKNRTPVAIVCDEAHLYLPIREETDAAEKRALDSFERIAKEGRKYGVSLLVVSQRPSDVSRTILSQCNNFLVLRLTNDQDQTVVRRLMPDSMAGLTDILPLLDVGEALLLGDAVLLPTRIKLDMPEIQPASATRDFWTEWAQRAPNIDAIKEAVETLRSQTRAKSES